jgi:lysozyme
MCARMQLDVNFIHAFSQISTRLKFKNRQPIGNPSPVWVSGGMAMKKLVTIAPIYMALLVGCAPMQSVSHSGSGNQGQNSNPGTPPPATEPPPLMGNPPPTPTPAPAPVARPSSDPNLTVCAGSSTLKGVDVSDYDLNTNWPSVKSGGLAFTIIKASEGITFVNPLFSGDWVAASAAGLIRGAYHFYHPGDDPLSQANTFLATMGKLAATDLPPVLDWEVSDGVSAATQINNAKVWLQAVEAATGKIPIIYVGVSYWNGLGNPQGFERYPLYLAEYQVTCPHVPPPWSTWSIWQPADTNPVQGVSTAKADQDIFEGTLADLLSFANQ